MDKSFTPTLHHWCDYLSMLGLKLNHVRERGPWSREKHATWLLRSGHFPMICCKELSRLTLTVTQVYHQKAVSCLGWDKSISDTGACLDHPSVRDNYIHAVWLQWVNMKHDEYSLSTLQLFVVIGDKYVTQANIQWKHMCVTVSKWKTQISGDHP